MEKNVCDLQVYRYVVPVVETRSIKLRIDVLNSDNFSMQANDYLLVSNNLYLHPNGTDK